VTGNLTLAPEPNNLRLKEYFIREKDWFRFAIIEINSLTSF